jgi:hypothetical protein
MPGLSGDPFVLGIAGCQVFSSKAALYRCQGAGSGEVAGLVLDLDLQLSRQVRHGGTAWMEWVGATISGSCWKEGRFEAE